eukprot:CAMPEP_0194116824 /NCGR_PEP_ID=MMETSP0150-20130528/28684_1 /TAXON_ID=122233 /ORGANISM="Chaetoceros debilis, Strain MM31A-1" /LENGTH=364 /DNA_ID=CAMNT_0038807639 /DNA_START=63 /DNA_END=1157 /DNA_ORIENTATION=-
MHSIRRAVSSNSRRLSFSSLRGVETGGRRSVGSGVPVYGQTCSSNIFKYFSSSAFQPPPPNTYNAPAVYDNIPITKNGTVVSSLSIPSSIRKNDPDAVYVVTGASRSMGLEYVKTLLCDSSRAHPSSKIIACCRNPSSAVALHDFLDNACTDEQRNRVQVKKMDVTSDDDISSLAAYIQETTNRVDVLFNVAGVLGNPKTLPGPERNIKQFNKEWFQSQMDVNAIGPMMVTQQLAPFLKVSRKDLKNNVRSESVVVNMSARVGSIGDNMGGLGWHSYRMSKAALNMGTRTLAHELGRSGTWTIALYPGFTDTDMSVPFQTPAMKEKGMVFPVDFTVGRMLDVVENMEKKHSGGMYDWSGIALPF